MNLQVDAGGDRLLIIISLYVSTCFLFIVPFPKHTDLETDFFSHCSCLCELTLVVQISLYESQTHLSRRRQPVRDESR